MANRDKSQGVGFFYSNIYELYKKSEAQAKEAATGTESSSGRFISVEDLSQIKANSTSEKKLSPLDDLRENMKRLNDLHAKLRFMLQELEDIVAKK